MTWKVFAIVDKDLIDWRLFVIPLIRSVIMVDSNSLIRYDSTCSSVEEKKDDQLPCVVVPALPVDRNWIIKLLQKHRNPATPNDLQDKALVVAPMVDQSDLPFRLLCRKYGANLAYTPMIHTKLFCHSPDYRNKFFDLKHGTPAHDRPLIAQLCGSDLDLVLQTAQAIEPFVDGIDINCGCPQQIAKRGQYGAFLLEQEEVLLRLVRHLAQHLRVPLSVKVRLLPTGVADSLRLYEKLVDAGAHLLTIHGRNRIQKAGLTGMANWDAIRQAVDLLGHRIPIFANGSIATLDDVRRCVAVTNVDGVMSSEAVLEYPALFYALPTMRVGRIQLAREYLQLARQYPPQEGGQASGIKCIRMHIHRTLHGDMKDDHKLRKRVQDMETIDELEGAVYLMEARQEQCGHDVQQEALSWYMRYRTTFAEPTLSESHVDQQILTPSTFRRFELQEDAGECMSSMFGDAW